MFLCKTSAVNKTAHVDNFVSLQSHILLGKRLHDVKMLQSSIANFGLVSPLTVTPDGDKFIIIDGCKRLAALRRLAFTSPEHKTPDQKNKPIWAHVPYVLFEKPQGLDASAIDTPDIDAPSIDAPSIDAPSIDWPNATVIPSLGPAFNFGA